METSIEFNSLVVESSPWPTLWNFPNRDSLDIRSSPSKDDQASKNSKKWSLSVKTRFLRALLLCVAAVAVSLSAPVQAKDPAPTPSASPPNVTIPVPPAGPYAEKSQELPLLTEETGLQAAAGTIALYEYNPFDNAYIPTSYYPCQAHLWAWPPNPVDAVYNDCNRRVWLNQYPDGTGWGVCVNPYIIYYPANNRRDPSAIEVTGVGYCP